MPAEKGRSRWGRVGLGLDFSRGELTAVCVSRHPDGVASTVAGEALQALLQDRARCVVAASIPISRSLCVNLELPFADERRARRVLPSLLDIQLPFALEQAAYCFPEVTGSARSALAVVARHTDVEAVLESLRTLNADPMILDHEGLALWSGGLRWQQQESGGTHGDLLVVHVANGRVVLVHGRDGAYRTALETRADDPATIRRLLAALLGPRDQQANSGADGPCRILLCGDALDQAPDCVAVIEGWGGVVSHAPESDRFLAEALARRALQSDAQPYPCNLRVGAHAHHGTARHGRRSLVAGVTLCWVGAALLLAASVVTTTLAKARVDGLHRQLDGELDRTAGFNVTTRGAHARQQVARAVEEERARYAAVSRQFVAGPGAHLWEVLTQAHQQGLVVAAYSLSDAGLLRLDGRMDPEGRLADFIEWLTQLGWAVDATSATPPEFRIVATPVEIEEVQP